ncbi:MAG: hypothetical protein ABR961_14685 [Thermoanaerobaculaceae bacterium]
MRLVQEILEHARCAGAALVVSTFPERAKRTGWPAVYASVAAHVVSGWVEMAVAACLFVVGFLGFGERFNNTAGWTYVSHQQTLTNGDFFGVGIIGYLSYLLTPFAWITVWCFGEGILRALDAALSSRMLGMALVVLPWRAAGVFQRARARRTRLGKLGPERPDEVVSGARGTGRVLTVYASREKEWSTNQAIEYKGEFFVAAEKRFVRHGDHHAFRYGFRRLEPGEVIRGVLARYAPDGAPDASAGGPPPAQGTEAKS